MTVIWTLRCAIWSRLKTVSYHLEIVKDIETGIEMAYRLKTITYLGAERKILLQNENGPCPLIACANVLLLRGALELPPNCVRNDVASIEDLVNILAERSLKQITSKVKLSNESHSTEDTIDQSAETHHEYHVNDLLNIFPMLQYGMDVNPTFTAGPFGVEYTKNVELFDLLGVDLCHGWLLDPQDIETASVIDRRSYNELTYMIIQGKEAFAEIHHLEESIAAKEEQLQNITISSVNDTPVEDVGIEIAQTPMIFERAPQLDKTMSGPTVLQADFDNTSADVDLPHVSVDCTSTALDTCSDIVSEMMSTDDGLLFMPSVTIEECQKEINHLRNLHAKVTFIAAKGAIIDAFFTASGHQLTYYGIHELLQALNDDHLYVFFRNNHFSTITKHNAELFLLVTDLGYGNVEDVIWEKLDNIDGDTEYFDSYFERTPSKHTFAPAPGPSLSPELLLAQSGQTGADYHIALQLSENEGKSLDEQERWLLSAATEQSIAEWKNENRMDQTADGSSLIDALNNEATDESLALKLAAQFEKERLSEHLAQRLHAEERWRAAEHRRPSSSGHPNRKANRTNCIIS
jgi:hypothetical protein